MGRRFTARDRVKLELKAALVLAVVLGAALLWRAMAGPGEQQPGADGEKRSWWPARPEPTEISEDMFEWKPGEYVHVEWGPSVSDEIDESLFEDVNKKTAADLVNWAEMAWENQWGYVWGTFGTVLDQALLDYKIEQYGEAVSEYEDIIRDKWLFRRTVDCAGLIKSYGWYDPQRHEVSYCYGDMPDMGTDGFYANAVNKGPIDTLPETPGLLVYAEGHIGVYIGDGWAVEAISHAGGVVKTRVADRTWTDWLECPYIQY